MSRKKTAGSSEYLALKGLLYKLRGSIEEHGAKNKEFLDFLENCLGKLVPPVPNYVNYRFNTDLVYLFPQRPIVLNSYVGSGLVIPNFGALLECLKTNQASESLLEAVEMWYEDFTFLTSQMIEAINRDIHLSYTELIRDLPWIENYMAYKKPLKRLHASSAPLITKENSDRIKLIFDYVCFINHCTFTINSDGTVTQKEI